MPLASIALAALILATGRTPSRRRSRSLTRSTTTVARRENLPARETVPTGNDVPAQDGTPIGDDVPADDGIPIGNDGLARDGISIGDDVPARDGTPIGNDVPVQATTPVRDDATVSDDFTTGDDLSFQNGHSAHDGGVINGGESLHTVSRTVTHNGVSGRAGGATNGQVTGGQVTDDEVTGDEVGSQITGGDESVPLEIIGLTKAYRNGELAVDDLSFRVERGQVLGLLGPNGAGKTTTMRMMMGLIQPDAGEVRIFGDRVTPGAPVLSRLGSFVEGPGFLPHLSGRDNIELYWAATGRPTADAHFDEALEIADLGKALERAVRTYSQGMRQRLAIAQAMLGLPDLLVLDEPTNGLDPPQIREMRQVLRRYADDGRTVIVSSHLLAEVEQTCSHVVVMHRGRLVSAGLVSVLLSGASSNGHGPRLEDVFLDLIGQNS
jgi:ABC-2 type transport system ATP-binding protein